MRALTKMSRVGVPSSRARCCPSLGRTQVLVLKPVTMVLFAVGNHIPAPPHPPCPLSALLRSLCTPANTRLITPLSIGPRSAPKGQEVLSSPCCLSISAPSYRPLRSVVMSFFFFCLKCTSNLRFLDALTEVGTCCTLIKPAYFDSSATS